ncbi:MAG: glycosyltransferase family 4 protein [Verrucomicrobia bacterium]|nr:glycosyltransferase family 4 protein [Deltaproteobacteria bacterium]
MPPAPLRVLYLLHDTRRSGVPAVLAHLIGSLDRSRVVPTVLVAYDGIYARELRECGVAVASLGRRLPVLWRLNRFLLNIRLVRMARRADVIHVNSAVLALSVLIASQLGARVVFHLHEKPGRLVGLIARAIGAADCVVFCARNCADHFTKLPAREKRVFLNAIRLPPESAPGLVAAPLKIVMFGSINRNKGQDLLLRAFSLLERQDAELIIYGTVGLSAHGYVRGLKKFVEENDLSGRVFFPGPTNDAEEVLRGATLLVHSSLNECLSISVLEAMAQGVPVIANDIAGMNEVISDGVDGFLVETGNIEMMAQRIAQLLGDPALRARMGEAGRQTVREKFNMAQRVEEFMGLYEELCRR